MHKIMKGLFTSHGIVVKAELRECDFFVSLTPKCCVKGGLPSFSITYYKSIGSTYIHILTSFDCFKRLVGKSSISFLTLLNIHECDLVSMGNKQASSSSADRLSRPRHRFFHVIVFQMCFKNHQNQSGFQLLIIWTKVLLLTRGRRQKIKPQDQFLRNMKWKND